MYIYIYAYIYKKNEREKERESKGERGCFRGNFVNVRESTKRESKTENIRATARTSGTECERDAVLERCSFLAGGDGSVVGIRRVCVCWREREHALARVFDTHDSYT